MSTVNEQNDKVELQSLVDQLNDRNSSLQSSNSDLKEVVSKLRDKNIFLEDSLAKFLCEPLVHATVVSCKNQVDPASFQKGDLVWIANEERTGRIFETPDEDGYITVIFSDLSKNEYQIGLHEMKPDVKLLGKNDGTNVIIVYEGSLFEVMGVWGEKFQAGETVKVHIKSRQIVEKQGEVGPGNICSVKKVLDGMYVEVDVEGRKRIVMNGLPDQEVQLNDRLQLDHYDSVIIRHLGKEQEEEYVVNSDSITTSWADIGGCDSAKDAIIEAVELPYKHPDVYKYYNHSLPKGILLWGPPGCGKTLIAKATARSIAESHGKDFMSTGFIYVKGPELLKKYVGESESEIQQLFRRGYRHHEKTGVPALLFIDEAEAIVPERGSGISSDVNKTIVPMFLSEMDGLEESRIIVMLATNRPDMIDAAVVRPGRVDRRIRVPRPNEKASSEIFSIHMKGIPLYRVSHDEASNYIIGEIFSKQWALYNIRVPRLKEPHVLTLTDCVTGAMIAGVVREAVSTALRRDLQSNKKRGVTMEDFRGSLKKLYQEQFGQNHSYEIAEFLEDRNLKKSECQIDRVKVA